jgi:hypothetical protein
MKKLILLLFVFLTVTLNAQQISTYLDKGVSGFGITAGYEGAPGSDAIMCFGSYSYKGKLDITLGLYNSYWNKWQEGLTNFDATDLYLSGDVTWWAIREKVASDIDVNFGLTAGFNYDTYFNYTYEGGSYLGYYGGYVGSQFNLSFNTPIKWKVQPQIATYFDFGVDQYEEGGVKGNEGYYGLMCFFGASLVKQFENKNSLVFSFMQGVSNYNQGSAFDISIAYVFSFD